MDPAPVSLPLITVDDRRIWSLWLSKYWFVAITAAHEVGLFDRLRARPATVEELAEQADLNLFALKPVVALLAALGLLRRIDGRLQLTAESRTFLCPDTPFYWGGPLAIEVRNLPLHPVLVKTLTDGSATPRSPSVAAEAWESGQIGPELAEQIAAYMNAMGVPAAVAAGKNGDFAGVRRLLDVGGGSGCYSIALATHNPGLHCTVMDMAAMCTVVTRNAAASGVSDSVDTIAVDMFREAWPAGFDAVFFSNIFHDWGFETCRDLAGKAFAILPSGGTIYLNEMLLDDDGLGPVEAAAFSLLMLLGTQGQQFTGPELRDILEGAGFDGVTITPTNQLFSLISAKKP